MNKFKHFSFTVATFYNKSSSLRNISMTNVSEVNRKKNIAKAKLKATRQEERI